MTDFYGTQYAKTRDVGREMIDVSKWRGRVRHITDHIALLGASVAPADRVFVAKIPSNAVILPQSTVYFDALTGATAVDFGDAVDPDGLATDISMIAAGSSTLLEAIAIENYGKQLWEHLVGYTKDPGKELDLFFTFNDLTVDGDLRVVLLYVVD